LRGDEGATATDGRMAMDLRYAVFTRIARDDVLKRLLVNYADRLDDSAVGNGTASDTCYLTLEWTADDRTNTPSEAESVTFRAHVPRHRREDYSCLDVVMYRLEAALATDGTDSSIAILRRRSREAVECGADSVFRTRTYSVSAVPRRAGMPYPADGGATGSGTSSAAGDGW
jgi:hypothetical protein